MNGRTEDKEGRPLSARIIEDVNRELEASEIVFRKKIAAVGGIADRNGHIRKYVGEGGSVSWGGA